MAANKGGRPKKILDYDAIVKLAGMFCTQEEIARFLDVSTRTLMRDETFCHIYKRELETAKQSLRRKQLELAVNGNVTMLIFLGKQYLGQSDRPDETAIKRADHELNKERLELDKKKAEITDESGDRIGTMIDAIKDAVKGD